MLQLGTVLFYNVQDESTVNHVAVVLHWHEPVVKRKCVVTSTFRSSRRYIQIHGEHAHASHSCKGAT